MKCELCGSESSEIITTQIREGYGKIARCKCCGLIYQNTDFTGDELEKYYNGEYKRTNSLDSGREQSAEEHFKESIKTVTPIYERVMNHMKRLDREGELRVLEIGSGTGELLHMLSPHIREGVGIDLNRSYVEWANENLDPNLKFIGRDVNGVAFDSPFDLIISIHTLEHLPDLMQTFHKMRSILSDDGILYLELPNRDEALNYYLSKENEGKYQRFSWHKAHMFYFTKETVRAFVEKAGFRCEEVSCVHTYGLRNYLQWFFCGKGDSSFGHAVNDNELFDGDSQFEIRMNELMRSADILFKGIMRDTWGGDTLCVVAGKGKK